MEAKEKIWEERSVLKEFRTQRKSFFELSGNDFRAKYANSLLGAVWAFAIPLVTILVLWFVFEVGLRAAPVNDVPFMLFYIPAFVAWNFFSDAFSSACGCLREYSYVVKKMKFHVELLPVMKILSSFYVHVFFLAFSIVVFFVYGKTPDLYNLQVIYYLFCLLALLLGLSFLFSSLAVFSGDIANIVSVVLQVGFWATPIIWSVDTMPSKVQYILKLNPMFYICNGYRDCFVYKEWFWDKPALTLYFWAVTGFMLLLGGYAFRRLRPQFSDVL